MVANDEQPQKDAPQEYAEEEVEEWEATALNALGDLTEDDPVDCTSLGEALQLEFAALAAFGKASGKGKNKGKGKYKGKLVRSNLTLEQRRAKLGEINPKVSAFAAAALDIGPVTPFVDSQMARGRRRRLPASRRLLWLPTCLNPQTVPMMVPAQSLLLDVERHPPP